MRKSNYNINIKKAACYSPLKKRSNHTVERILPVLSRVMRKIGLQTPAE